jgi:hypothetical protein
MYIRFHSSGLTLNPIMMSIICRANCDLTQFWLIVVGLPIAAVSAGRVISLKTMRFVVATGSENTVAMW